MLNVSPEDAYAEACRALGEAIVTQRLMGQELQRRDEAEKPDPDQP